VYLTEIKVKTLLFEFYVSNMPIGYTGNHKHIYVDPSYFS